MKAVSSWINAGPCGTIADLRIYGRDLDAVAIAGEAGLNPTQPKETP